MTANTYSIHPSIAYTQAIISNLQKKTGRSLEEWVSAVKQKGPAGEKAIQEWLKGHGLGSTQAWIVAERAVLANPSHAFLEDTPEGYLKAAETYVAAMYEGKKAPLKPLYDALLKLGLSLGKDVKACPCKTIVPLYREHVFAQLKPTTQSRLDLGLSLKDTPGKGRLISTGGFAKKDRISHRMEVKSLSDINDELRGWLEQAYQLGARDSRWAIGPK